MGFIDAPDIKNKSFATASHADVSSQSIQLFNYDTSSNRWTVEYFNEDNGTGVGKIWDERTGKSRIVEIKDKASGKWEKVK